MSVLKFIRGAKPVNVQAPQSGLDVEYPSQAFSGRNKPSLVIPLAHADLESVRHAFAFSIQTSKPDLDAGKEFVYRFMKEQKESLEEEWKSYGVIIGGSQSQVSCWDLFEVTEKTVTPTVAGIYRLEPEVDLGFLILFCSVYRLAAIGDPAYLAAVAERISSQALMLPSDIPKPEAMVALVGRWVSDANYLKMIAGIDMFLHKFPKSICVQVRISTISSRYRDCASLLSIRFFLQMIGSDVLNDAVAWITYEAIAHDLIRMTKTDEEAGAGESYFPYQADMGLVRKSAYSTVANPSYFFFVHAVGSLLGLTRSRNARMSLEYGLAGAVQNAFLVAYIHKRNHQQQLQFTVSGAPVVIDGSAPDTEIDQQTLRSNNPVKWTKFMMARGWVFTPFMIGVIKDMQTELIATDTREGTIGDFTAKHTI